MEMTTFVLSNKDNETNSNLQIVIHPHVRMQFSNKKKQITVILIYVDESPKHHIKWEQPDAREKMLPVPCAWHMRTDTPELSLQRTDPCSLGGVGVCASYKGAPETFWNDRKA